MSEVRQLGFQKEVVMKAIYLVALSLGVLLSACAGGTFQTAGEYEPANRRCIRAIIQPPSPIFSRRRKQSQRRIRRNLATGNLYLLWAKPNISPETMRKHVRLCEKSFRSTRATMSHDSTLALRKPVSETARRGWRYRSGYERD